MQKVDYNSTLNLPNTNFPMRANLPEKEKEILKKWEDDNTYERLKEKKKDFPNYTLHDGPPYANGAIHMGHALNKILKDFVVRYKNMSGYKALLIPGWDTHGLPTELKAMKKVKSGKEVSAAEIRRICKEFVKKYIDEQKEGFKRLGVIADFKKPYITLEKDYEAAQLEVFAKMVSKGCIYRGLKPVYWCGSCRTALAEAEIEYQKDICKSIYVKFKVEDDRGIFKDLGIDPEKVNFLIWTTTTWTLPANVAICLNKYFVYSLVKCEDKYYVVAKNLVETVMQQGGVENYEKIKDFKGQSLEKIKTKHPFLDKTSLVVLGDHVTLESGTGCVHTAPGHGLEDFSVCQNYEELREIPVAVDYKGKMTEICGEFSGLTVEEANEKIYESLEKNGRLFATKTYEHSYPHCWRCKKPVIFRATKQWFCSVDSFKEDAVKESRKVNWIPSWGKDRIKSMITERKDWCISRQRRWGVPIPVFYCENCEEPLLREDVILHVSELFRKNGADVWYEKDEKDLLPDDVCCNKCGYESFVKETDILDVWFDSGVSHTSVCKQREELNFPADLYLEGADQYRGWFQSSLLTSVAANGVAPYKTVVTHGWVVDGEGRKQSKSLGNGISPEDIVKIYGADVLRLWVASSDYHADVKISEKILKQIAESYRKIRNTARYILGNIFDLDISKELIELENLLPLDKWILYKLNYVIRESIEGYETFEFSKVYRNIYTFCVVELSNYYLDVIKDRLYVRAKKCYERKSAQTTIYLVLNTLIKLLAPILPFTSNEVWEYIPHQKVEDNENILFNNMPAVLVLNLDNKFINLWTKIDSIREKVVKKLEVSRAGKSIGSSLEAEVTIDFVKKEDYELFKHLEKTFAEIFIVSKVNLRLAGKSNSSLEDPKSDFVINIGKAKGEKCPRCWCFSEYIDEKDGKFVCEKCEKVLSSS